MTIVFNREVTFAGISGAVVRKGVGADGCGDRVKQAVSIGARFEFVVQASVTCLGFLNTYFGSTSFRAELRAGLLD